MAPSPNPSEPASERRLTLLGAAVGSLAHDLQNLLLVLRLEAGSLARGLGRGLSESAPEHLPTVGGAEALQASLQELEDLTDRLARLSEPEISVVDSTTLLDRVVSQVRPAAGPSLQAYISDDLPPVRCDPLLLRLALAHLARTAIERRSDGPGPARLHASRTESGRLQIEISDDAPQEPPPSSGHNEFGPDPGWTVAKRAVRLARGTLEKDRDLVRIVLPAAQETERIAR